MRSTFRFTVALLAALMPNLTATGSWSIATEDTATPVLSSFARQGSGAFAPGDTIQVNYVASDTGSGIQAVIFYFLDPIRQLRQVRADLAAAPTGPATAVVGDTWPSGAYQLTYIYLVDNAGNSVQYAEGEMQARLPDRLADRDAGEEPGQELLGERSG
jgi:hypothetical protein